MKVIETISVLGLLVASGIVMAIPAYDPECTVTLVAKQDDAYTQLPGQPANFKDRSVVGSNGMAIFSGSNTAEIKDIDSSWTVNLSKNTSVTINSNAAATYIDLQQGEIIVQDNRKMFKLSGLGFSTRKIITKSKKITAGSKATTYLVKRSLDDTFVEVIVGVVNITYRTGTLTLYEKSSASFDSNGDLVEKYSPMRIAKFPKTKRR